MSLQILKNAKDNLGLLRRTGSTTTLKTLYKSVPNFVLVTNNYIYGQKIKKEFNGHPGRITCLSVLGAHDENLRGVHDPVAVDTSALLEVLELGIQEIESRDRNISYLKGQLTEFDSIIKWIGRALLRFRPGHYDEKRWNLRGGRDYNKIDEAKRVANLAIHIINCQYLLFRKRSSTIKALKYGRISHVKYE